jgi:CheY-like chemotaxis protein
VKVLFVEDEPELHGRVRADLEPSGIFVTTAENAAQAVQLIDAGGFDLFLCDLRIPASLEASLPHKEHGLRVFDHMRVASPGVPIIIFTGYGDKMDLRDRLSEAPRQNLYGDGPSSLVIERTKDEYNEVIEIIRGHRAKLDRLAGDIEVSGAAPAVMEELDTRLVRIHSRSHGAVTIRVDLLGGGRSGACVLRLHAKSGDGLVTSRVVAKLNTLEEVEDELKRYEQFVAILGAGDYTNHTETLCAGAQDRGALFYGLADGYDSSLFDLLESNDPRTPNVVRDLRSSLQPWHGNQTVAPQTVGDIRRLFVSDASLAELPALVDWRNPALETIQVYTHRAPAHGDLHGGNILVDASARPMLIDFGRVGLATNAVDPVTLEFSVVLHPDRPVDFGDWPTVSQAENSMDLPAYLDGCPIPEFISACREWTTDVSGGAREINACVFAYSLRQLRYPGEHHLLAAAFSRGAAARLQS